MSRQSRQVKLMRDHADIFEQLIEAIPLALSICDMDGRLAYVNRAFEEFHNVDRRSVLGRPVREVLPSAEADAIVPQEGWPIGHETTEFEAVLPATHLAAERVVKVRQQVLHHHDDSMKVVLVLEQITTEMRRHEKELRDHGARLSQLAAQLLAAQEDERRRIARDLHDQVGQILTALRLQLAAAARSDGSCADLLRAPLELANEALTATRDLTSALHPHVLDDLGLQAALRWLLGRYVLPSLPDVRFECRLVPERADARIEIVAFRVVQEALTNVLRHAHATCAELSLRTGDGWLRIDIGDDGEGFVTTDTWFDGGRQKSVGMNSMRERVEDLGGELAIDSAPNMGTQLRILLPWPTIA